MNYYYILSHYYSITIVKPCDAYSVCVCVCVCVCTVCVCVCVCVCVSSCVWMMNSMSLRLLVFPLQQSPGLTGSNRFSSEQLISHTHTHTHTHIHSRSEEHTS